MPSDKEYPYGRCFVMMPISDQGDYKPGHFDRVYEQIFKPAIKNAGYEPYRVDENKISDSIITKIFDAIQNCEMALCDMSNRNPNVMYELGIRQAYNKPVVLVQDDKTERIFDVSSISTTFYKSNRLYENVLRAQEEIKAAIDSTREGNEMSLIQYVKASSASFGDDEPDKEDSLNIMLKSIMNEIKDLKNNNKYYRPETIYEDSKLDKSVERTMYVVQRKSGVTNKQLKERLNFLKSRQFVNKLFWEIQNDKIIIEIESIPSIYNGVEIKESIEEYIEQNIGSIMEHIKRY